MTGPGQTEVSAGAGEAVPAPPTSSGYVEVGELDVYYERHGHGPPLVLLHGAMGTIESCFAGLLPLLARHFEVIAVELQGHGHTRDVARTLTYEDMSCDIAALLDALDIESAHVVGYSMGGAVALQLASIGAISSTTSSSLVARPLTRAAYTLSCWRLSNRSIRASSTEHRGRRPTVRWHPTRRRGSPWSAR